MNDPVKRITRLLGAMDKAWEDFHESFAGLSDEQLLEPGAAGDWSVKDVIAHISWWEEEALKHLPVILDGGRPPRYSDAYGGIDAFNALMAEQRRVLSLSEVRDQAADTHQRLIDYVRSLPPAHLIGSTRVRRQLRLDTYGHYPHHAEAIRQWREQRGI